MIVLSEGEITKLVLDSFVWFTFVAHHSNITATQCATQRLRETEGQRDRDTAVEL